MFTIIGGDGKEYGPVTADQIRGWVAAGRANLDTQAKLVGSAEWKRLRDFPEFAGGAAMPPPVATAAIPAQATGPVDVKLFADDLIARTAKIDVFDCLGRAFDLWKNNFLGLVGVTLLMIIIQMAIGLVPILGAFANLFLNGVFYGGLYYYYLGKLRGQPRQVGDIFAGFSKAFLPLMLGTLLITGLSLLIMLPFCFPWALFFIKVAMQGANGMGGVPPMPGGWLMLTMLFGVLVIIYFSISWMFTLPLIIDRGLGPWTALCVSHRVVRRQWFRVFFVAFLGTILAMLGVIGLIIGVVFTIPLAFCAVICAYESICNPPAATTTAAVAPTPAPAPAV